MSVLSMSQREDYKSSNVILQYFVYFVQLTFGMS